MKLTNTIRDAFIRSAMNDVPSVDYTELARSLVLSDSIAQLPQKVRVIAKDKDLSHFIETNSYHLRELGYMTVMAGRGDHYKPSTDVGLKLDEMAASQAKQRASRNDLQSKLRSVAYSVSTRKSLADMLPEFAKYLPADEQAAIKTLPVIANVVADFTKAGWPKGKKPTKAEA